MRMQAKKTGRRLAAFCSWHHGSQTRMVRLRTTELPEDEPAVVEEELMAVGLEEVELDSMFPADGKPDTEAHAFIKFGMATKI